MSRHKRRKRLDHLNIVTHNVRVARNPSEVAGAVAMMIDAVQPHVVMLQEVVPRYLPGLRSIPGYRLIVERGWVDSTNCVTLVRRDVPIKRWRTIRNRIGWRGPVHGWARVGRTFQIVDLYGWRLVNVHRTRLAWGAAAYAEEDDALRRIAAKRRSQRPAFVVVGDQNEPYSDNGPYTPGRMARDIGLEPVGRSSIDYALVRGCDGHALRLNKYGSDHYARLVRLNRT